MKRKAWNAALLAMALLAALPGVGQTISKAGQLVLFAGETLPAAGIQLQATGMTGVLKYSGNGLPDGLTISDDGVLKGTLPASTAGAVSYRVDVTDSIATKKTLLLTLQIADPELGYWASASAICQASPDSCGSKPKTAFEIDVLEGAASKILLADSRVTLNQNDDLKPWGFDLSGNPALTSASAKANVVAGQVSAAQMTYSLNAGSGNQQTVMLALKVLPSETIVLQAPGGNPAPAAAHASPAKSGNLHLSLVAGAEQSALSSEDTEFNAFVQSFALLPLTTNAKLWLELRLLGTATASSTLNLQSAVQSATGESSSSALSQVGAAVDYTIGWEHKIPWLLQESAQKLSFIVGLGATTPLSSQHATVAYQVPAYGSNECSLIFQRYTLKNGYTALPAQPTDATGAPYPYIVTKTTLSSTGTTTTSVSNPYCIINPVPYTTSTTANGVTATAVVSGTAIQDLAFAPADRSDFLVKYLTGFRYSIAPKNASGSSDDATANKLTPNRLTLDATFGQNEAITGGMLRHFVVTTDAVVNVWQSVYFIGSASLRVNRDVVFSPLLLQPASIVTSSATPPGSTTVPMNSTWVLPLKQPDRDFYRFGVAVDVSATLKKLLVKGSD